MSTLAWPLQVNHIRRGIRNNAFGMVRNGGTRAHQGWDLYALPLTPCYAIADGIAYTQQSSSYGNMVVLKFQHRGQTLHAAYCHLSLRYVAQRGQEVQRGKVVALTHGEPITASGGNGLRVQGVNVREQIE